MVNWENYRRLFPHLPDQIYLNHAAVAPQNLRSQLAVKEYVEIRLEKNIEFWPQALEKKSYFRDLIGKLIDGSPDNIAITSNTSAGLNILALGLNWKAGDHILLNDFEFPSNVIPFLNLKRLGVEIDFVQHRDGVISLEDIAAKINPRTRILSISFVEFLNGFKNDLKAISNICRERNIIFSVDAIQGLGGLQMDMDEMGIDFLSCGGHKWLMWEMGIGFIYISPRIFDQIYPVQAGWLSLENPFDFFNYEQPFAPTAQRFEPGVFNTIGMTAAIATLELMLEIGPKNIEDKILANTEFLIEKIRENNIELYTRSEKQYRSGIVTFYHPDAEDLYHHLIENKVTVSLREGKIRVSPHFYNDIDDLQNFFTLVLDFKPKK
jgi:selenocysteine lyase/cysteine desulfurase